jgi:REP element-mobilizing transposase RayT
MARPVRLEVAGGWYHLTARGNERKAIYWDTRDRWRFLELLEQWGKRFDLRLHAYVLLDNHYHLLVETAQPNLSRAMQWLGVSYTVWFNRRHGRVGHLFQGRYQAVLVEAGGAAWEVSRYVHLNPVRIAALGQGKRAQQLAAAGMDQVRPDQVREALARLYRYRWSSYRAYVGLVRAPPWLTVAELLRQSGEGNWRVRRQAYRRGVEELIRQGVEPRPWESLTAGLLLGSREFVQGIKGSARGNPREQPSLRQLRSRPGWADVVAAVEVRKGEPWGLFRDRHGDWGRDLALYLGRRRGGLRLRELAEQVGLDYSSVQVAVRRFALRLTRDAALRKIVRQLETQLYDDDSAEKASF